MKIKFNTIANRINLSSPINFCFAVIACVLTTCFLSDIITVYCFNIRIPDVMAKHEAEIRLQTFITTASISTVFFSAMLLLIRHVNHLRSALSEEIRYDTLTGLLSREAFLNEVKDNEKIRGINAFLLIDADFFKRINDTHGHLVGDEALITMTNALQQGVRSSDFIGRIGGEEFGVHLKNVDKARALEIAERLRLNVKETNTTFGYADIDLSVSIGAVVYEETIALPDLMKQADELLYKAKKNGRNRVEHIMLRGSAISAV